MNIIRYLLLIFLTSGTAVLAGQESGITALFPANFPYVEQYTAEDLHETGINLCLVSENQAGMVNLTGICCTAGQLPGKNTGGSGRDDGPLQIGMMAPNFAQPDTNGNLVFLSDFRGKYVYLFFWEVENPACEREIHSLLNLCKRYDGQKFALLTVAIGASCSQWKTALKSERMDKCMVNLCDFKSERNHPDAKGAYMIQQYPSSYLISPNGQILEISRNEKDFEKKLNAIFNDE